MSCVDDGEGGWTLDDSIYLAARLRAVGVDVVDCTSGGIGAPIMSTPKARPAGWQVPYAAAIRRDSGLATMAIGGIRDAAFAEEVIEAGKADLIGVAREALFNPNWPLHAALALMGTAGCEAWPRLSAMWLRRRVRDEELTASLLQTSKQRQAEAA